VQAPFVSSRVFTGHVKQLLLLEPEQVRQDAWQLTHSGLALKLLAYWFELQEVTHFLVEG